MKLIRNVYLPKSNKKLKPMNVLFDDKIVKITNEEIEDEQIEEIIDAEGMYLLPGAIDAQVHFTSVDGSENCIKEMGAFAVKGGFTSVIDSPVGEDEAIITSEQYCDSRDDFDELPVNRALWSKIDPAEAPYYFEDMEEMWDKGTIGFQIYTLTDAEDLEYFTYEEINDLFSDIPDKEMVVSINALDYLKLTSLQESMDEETLSQYQMDSLTKIVRRSLDNPIHFTNMTTFKAINYLISAQKRFDISFDLRPEYFIKLHTDGLVGAIFSRSYQKRNEERNNMKDMFKFCRASILATHYGLKDKNMIYNSDLPESKVNDYPYHIPFLYTEFFSNPKAQMSQFINLTAENIARTLNIYPRKGSIEKGADADFYLLDPNDSYTVDDVDSNYHGYEMSCRLTHTFVRGAKVYSHSENVKVVNNGQFFERNVL